ncbi:DUF4189 domain-containing protein [Luteimonas aquatica]|uniref:DUF4189 domain-containing protein n=1 Tax=Luteimonas aquatica TaxID=450364 RepID=UPI001F56CD65|nr:DUF4189 domain-containing protein [Luteimonas aquatica]
MKDLIGLLALACALLFSGSASAEQGCPDGFMPNAAGTPGQPCVPGRMQTWGGGEEPAAPSSYNGYGAYAFDEANLKVGVSDAKTSHGSSGQAKRSALKSCKQNGGTQCKIIATFKNECAVTVLGATDASGAKVAIYVGKGGNVEAAQENAKAQCGAAGSPMCEPAYADCVTPWQE